MEGGGDPYEKQLLDVFESCDIDGSGRLDCGGLAQLCDKLQLEEQGVKLIDCLLANNAQRRVTFVEFREGLLSLLGEGQKQKKFERSPEREVSPKYVFGKKKYGRRSRPESIDQDSDEACNTDESESEVFLQNPVPKKDNLLWPSAETQEPPKPKVYKKRRKSVDRRLIFDKDISSSESPEENFNKARVSRISSDEEGPDKNELVEVDCFPVADEVVKVTHSSPLPFNPEALPSPETFINMTFEASEEADNLRSVCKQLGIGQDGFLNKTQLTRLCKCIGMETKADYIVQELFEKLDVDMENKISFEEFLSLFLSGDVGTSEGNDSGGLDDLPDKRDDPTVTSGYSALRTDSRDRDTVIIGNEKDSLPCILDISNSGCMSLESVIGLWSSWGVSEPERLIENLGFGREEQVPFSMLHSTLENELKSMLVEEAEEDEMGSRVEPATDAKLPPISGPDSQILRAALGLYLTETKLLKVSMDQMHQERDKLQLDLAEANHRATLLAQEVDDHHARLEKSSQLQVKLLEQRHAEVIRELQEQSCMERDALSAQNTEMEKKIFRLQEEETRLREECLALRNENEILEKENQSLLDHVAKCEEDKLKLSEEIEILSQDQNPKLSGEQFVKKWEFGKEEKGMGAVIEKLAALQEENRSLRDRNDELTMELEVAMSKLSASTSSKNEGSNFSWLESELAADGDIPFARAALKDDEAVQDSSDQSLVGVQIEDSSVKSVIYEDIESEMAAEEESKSLSKTISGDALGVSLKVEGEELWSSSKDNSQKVEEARIPEHSLQLDSKQLQQLTKALEEFEKEAEKHISRFAESEGRFAEGKKTLDSNAVKVPDSTVSPDEESKVEEASAMSKALPPSPDKYKGRASKDLKTKLDFVKLEIVKILSEKEACSAENSVLRSRMFNWAGHGDASISSTDSEPVAASGAERVAALEVEVEALRRRVRDAEESHRREKGALQEQCKELERSLELMNVEYERCEDYWQQKLEEERNFYEESQKLMDEKQSSLEQKISEYAELFCQSEKNECGTRLAPIEERSSLERQVTDLEEECEELRARMKVAEALQQKHFEEKERIAKCLQEMEQRLLKEQKSLRKDSLDVAVQACTLDHKQQNGLHHRGEGPNKSTSKSRIKGIPKSGSPSCLSLANSLSNFPRHPCHGKSSSDTSIFGREVEDGSRNRNFVPHASTRRKVNELGSEENDELQNIKAEVESLETILSGTREKLHKQTMLCQNQAERLVQSDILVQKLYVENAFLRNYLQQCQEY
ncbi:ninein-like isoform X2 [Ischnura elegans]|uniref:ninein-like isoform X2 n=1 Tax=Ischnura elegans TaxID=197161 RepID=UPI001ED894A6|nr:ninein-like isoform X2 [Ischnura elegans]